MLKLKNRCIVVLKDEEEKSSNYRVPKELFLKFFNLLLPFFNHPFIDPAVKMVYTVSVPISPESTQKESLL